MRVMHGCQAASSLAASGLTVSSNCQGRSRVLAAHPQPEATPAGTLTAPYNHKENTLKNLKLYYQTNTCCISIKVIRKQELRDSVFFYLELREVKRWQDNLRLIHLF